MVTSRFVLLGSTHGFNGQAPNARTLQGGVYFAEGGYDRIAVKLFNTLDVDVFYVCGFRVFEKNPNLNSHASIGCLYFWHEQLEYDNDRSGDFKPLKHLPLDKVAVLGVVTTKAPEVNSVWPFGSSTL